MVSAGVHISENGGKDYVFMHNSADIDVTATAIVRAGYEFQGQKCSACSRVYAPRSQWSKLKEELAFMVKDIKVGDVKDFHNFMNAVIDGEAYRKIMVKENFAPPNDFRYPYMRVA